MGRLAVKVVNSTVTREATGSGAAQQVVNTTANVTNSTAQVVQKGTNDPTAGLMKWLGNLDPSLAIPVVLLAGLVVGAYLAYGWYREESVKVPEMEQSDMGDIVGGPVKRLLGVFGQFNGVPFLYGTKEMGTVVSDYVLVERSKDTDDLDADSIAEASVMSADEVKAYVEANATPHVLLEVRDSGLFGTIMWLLFDQLLGRDMYTEYFAVPKALVDRLPHYIFIPSSVQFREFGGVWFAATDVSIAALEAVVWKDRYSDALKAHKNFHEQVNYFSAPYTQLIGEIKEKGKLDAYQDLGDILEAVNNR